MTRPDETARMQQHFESPQRRAYRAHVDAQIEAGYFAAMRVLAVALIAAALLVLIAVLGWSWIAERVSQDAAVAATVMKF